MSAVIQTKPGNHGESTYNGAKIIRGPQGATVYDASLKDSPAPRIPQKGDHDENLADAMEAGDRKRLAARLLEYFDVDKESRKDWEERERRGLALMGIEDIPNDDASAGYVNSPGAAQVKLPMMLEAATHFQARAIAELFPAGGPVKGAINGERTKDRVAQADRIETFGNYYFTQKDVGYFSDTDQMLLYLPLSGSAFRKASQNYVTGLPELRYVKATNFIIPYSATSLEDANRYAHEFTLTGQDVRRAQESGMFIDIPLQRPADDDSKHSATSDRSDLRNYSAHDDDALYTIIEYHIQLEFEEDPEGNPASLGESRALLPYVVLVEKTNQDILLVRRNWDENKKGVQREKILWFTHHKFFPGLGVYGWGYPHVIGSLAKAANDGVNALLDSAYAANFQGGFITKEGKASGLTGEIEMEHGKWKPLDGAWEELSKAIYTPDFHPPSPALAQLVEQLLAQGQRFSSITEAAVGNADNRGPVGTTLALIEQSSVVPTAIHKRLHNSMGREFTMWARLMYLFMPDEYPYEIKNETRQLLREDFDGQVAVIPVSDPNIWSQTQRIALAQGTLQLQAQDPSLYPPAKKVEAHRRMLEAMRVPDIDSVAPEIETPRYLDPVSEGQLMLIGKGVQAFETQDHKAHLMIHSNQRAILVASPAFMAMDPQKQQMLAGGFDAHILDHMGLAYRRQVMQMAGIPLPPLDPTGQSPALPPELEAKITAAVVQHLPPVPSPPNAGQGGPSPQDEAQALQVKTQAAIQAKGNESEASIVRDTRAFAAEERRKEVAFHNEQQRAQRKAALDESIAKHATARDENRKDIKVSGEVVRTSAKDRLALRTKEALAKQQLTHKHVGKDQELQHGAASAAAELQRTEAQHAQSIDHAAEDQRQSLDQSDQEHQQGLEQGAAQHSQQLEQGAEEHESSLEREGESHEQSLEQTEEAGKLKVQQTKQQMKAKAVKKKPKKKAAK